MAMVPMGKLLRQLRKQRKWTQAMLGEGIASKSEISRIENGVREPDIFLLHELICRMGQSLRYFEIVVTGVENELICIREELLNFLKTGAWEEASSLLVEYEGLVRQEKKERYHKHYTEEVRKAIAGRQTDVALELPAFRRIVFSEKEELRKVRMKKGWSQEQVGGAVCTRETISKIENGRVPNHKNMRHLRSKLGDLEYDSYGYVVANEFSVYERVERYQQLVLGNPEEADRLLEEIRKELDMDHPVNLQFVWASELLADIRNKVLSPAEGMAGLERCLRCTMPEYDGMIYRIPHCEERVILNAIVQCLEQVGRKDAAEDLKEKIIKVKSSPNVTEFY